MKTMKSMKIDMLYLEQSIKQLKERNSFLKYGPKKRKPRKHKEWDKINSERTKRQRLGHVKELLLQTLKSVEVCHRAEISIWLEKNKIHFSFSPSDLNKTRNSDMVNNGFLQHMNSEHSYSKSQTDMEIETLNDVEYSEIYQSSGEWQKCHIRRLIHVMDCFHISHEAYHELRMVSKGHLPPLSRLAKEEQKMSEIIPYEKYPKVSIVYDWQGM